MVWSTGARQTRRAVLSATHFCDGDDEKVLSTTSKAFKSGNHDPKASSDDREFDVVVSFCILSIV